ncbi:MAG: hypothetical protein A2284_05880 [Deltaproteobacteria bacterium RIFOXYA12_FULL_61_11]|nr:MAG: hypothetical protein A2284_05880 [Deltaproteobacteria bacterium RIFOXYA12_FULL_61_11]
MPPQPPDGDLPEHDPDPPLEPLPPPTQPSVPDELPPSDTEAILCEHDCFYFSAAGDDAADGTDETSAWKTLQKVNTVSWKPGDKILFRRGDTWTGALKLGTSGTELEPIILGAYGVGERPVFRNPGGTWNRAITLDADYVIVQDLLVRDTSEAGIFIEKGAEHNILRNIEGVALGQAVVIKGNNNKVTGSYFHDGVMVVDTEGGDDDFGANGVVIRSSGNEIAYNRILRAKATSHDYGYDGGAIEFYSTDQSMNDNSIHHNWAQDCNGFMELGSRGGQELKNTLVSYNVSYNNGSIAGIHLGTTGFGAKVEDLRLENNTIVELSGLKDNLFWIWSPAVPTTLSLTNNIIYSKVKFGASNQVGFTHTNNLYYFIGGAALTITPGSDEWSGKDPGFVDLAGLDFHLRSDSPAIDVGKDLGHSLDYDGTTVPSGVRPELGAYER